MSNKSLYCYITFNSIKQYIFAKKNKKRRKIAYRGKSSLYQLCETAGKFEVIIKSWFEAEMLCAWWR